jgi:hypothetical protein
MEELKILVEMVSDLPTMAIWVLIGFFVYKVVIVGSTYGVLRLAIIKAHSWLTTPRTRQVMAEAELNGHTITIDNTWTHLKEQILRLKGIRTKIDSPYIHTNDVIWLKEAIDEKLAREQENAKQ